MHKSTIESMEKKHADLEAVLQNEVAEKNALVQKMNRSVCKRVRNLFCFGEENVCDILQSYVLDSLQNNLTVSSTVSTVKVLPDFLSNLAY